MKLSQPELKEFIFSDFTGKIIAILLACFLWYYVNIISVEKVYISLPISIINQPKDKIVDLPDDLAVRVEISSHEDVSRRIENIQAIIDLSDYVVGARSYPITLLNLPKDIKVNVSPNYQRVTVYDIISKTVPINLIADTNKYLANTSYTPTEITISGSSVIINTIKALNTTRLTYTIPSNSTLTTNIRISYPSGITVLDHDSVDVVLQFNKIAYTNEVILPITYREKHSRLQVIPITLPLQFVTTTSNIEPLLLNSEIEIDLRAIFSIGIHNVPIKIITPSNTYIVDPPKTLTIELINTDEITSELETFFDNSLLELPPIETNTPIDSPIIPPLLNLPLNDQEIINRE